MVSFVFFNSCEKDMPINFCEFQKDTVKIDSLKINNKVMDVGIDGIRSDAMTQEITPFNFQFSQRMYTKISHTLPKKTLTVVQTGQAF